MSPRDTVRQLLRRMVIVLSVLIVGMTMLSLASVLLIQREIRDVAREITPLVDNSNQMRIAVTDAQTSLNGYLLSGQPDLLEDYHRHRDTFDTARASFQERSRAIGQPDVADDFDAASTDWFALADVAADQAQDGQPPASIDETVVAFHRLTDAHAVLVEDIVELRQQRRDGYTRLMSAAAAVTGLVGVCGLIVTRRQSRHVLRRLTHPLQDLERIVSRQRQGADLRADTDTGATEVVALASAFNELADENAALERARERQLELYRATITVAGQLSSDAEDWDRACATMREGLGTDGLALHEVTARGHRSLLRDGPQGSLLDGVTLPDLLASVAGGRLLVSRREQVREMGQVSLREAATRSGMSAWVLVPLTVPGQVLGVLCIAHAEDYRWPGGELDAIDRFASYLTTALAVRQMVASMIDLDRQKSDFLATTSHELRTPLTSMAGYLELLEDGDFGSLTPQQTRALQVISRNVGRLRRLIDDLLMLNRLSSGEATSHWTYLDLGELSARVVESLAPVASSSGVDLTLHRPDQGLPVRGDRDQLERAIGNVVSNAIKFTGSPGRVTLTCTEQDGLAQVVCRDTGIGIPEADQERMFTRFYRASNAQSSQVQGTGLGLAIVQSVITSHEGSVSLTSVEGQGTTVTLTLPLVTTETAASSRG